MSSNIDDYLIDPADKDWAKLLAGWVPFLPSEFTVWMVNRFGDAICIFADGSIHYLDTGSGEVRRLAGDEDDFCTKIDQGDNADDWLMIPWVDDCVAAGLRLGPNQCYGFKIPPVLGGKYEIDNIEVTDLAVHLSFSADIYRQTKDLPEGTPVTGVTFKRG